ncbi:MAG: DEAD/DEAH box helicase [bacterium]
MMPMTSSPPSGSDAGTSTIFDLLHEGVRRWIYERRWRELRPIQERTARLVLSGDQDVLVSAATAGGKTEAAFLPIASRLAEVRDPGFACLAVIPLKALINDQHPRLEALFAGVGIEVHRWHGDVSASAKRKLKLKPAGVLLITPESLEALFVLQGPKIPALFASLRFVVVDEVHSFIGTERGRQLQSLLHRVELGIGRRVPRLALSATLGDLSLAAEFLRPGQAAAVARVTDDGGGTAIRLLIKGYEHRTPMPPPQSALTGEPSADEVDDQADIRDIARHMFAKLRTTNNLIFANSRARVYRADHPGGSRRPLAFRTSSSRITGASLERSAKRPSDG